MDEWASWLAPQLRVLDELAAQDGHMTRAAESLGIPQSSMSRRLRALEDMVGVQLLINQGRTVALTPAAVLLVQQTRGPLRELDAAVNIVAGEADPDTGIVRFGFPQTMGSGEMPDLVAEFHRQAPGIRLHLKQAHGADLTAALRTGDLDLAVVIPPPVDVPHSVIGVQEVRAALPADHPLATRRRLQLAQLGGETFIANPPSYNLRLLTESWCADAGFAPDVAIEITEFDTIRELIGRGMGVALLPPAHRETPGVREVGLVGAGHRREIGLAWGPTAGTPAVRRLRAFLLDRFGS